MPRFTIEVSVRDERAGAQNGRTCSCGGCDGCDGMTEHQSPVDPSAAISPLSD